MQRRFYEPRVLIHIRTREKTTLVNSAGSLIKRKNTITPFVVSLLVIKASVLHQKSISIKKKAILS